MKVLFDLISTQTFFGNGGAEYVRKVFYTLLDYIKERSSNFELLCIYDSDRPLDIYEDLNPIYLKEKGLGVIDIKHKSLKIIIEEESIDALFIGIAQFWLKYDVENIRCRTIVVVHDLFQEEFAISHLKEYLCLPSKSKFFIEQTRPFIHRIRNIISQKKNKIGISRIIDCVKIHEDSKCIAVSNYTKYSLLSNYHIHEDKIVVSYSPERFFNYEQKIADKGLNNILKLQKKYYLVLSADRPAKNAIKAINAFDKYRNNFLKSHNLSDLPVLVTVGAGRTFCEGHFDLPSLSESDLVHAYKSCYAFVYPSYFEGFGYPPMEAMKYSKPVLTSNTTSIPEVLGEAAIYFSPLFETDIFKAFCTLTKENYNDYSAKASKRYELISQIQKADLDRLVELIIK